MEDQRLARAEEEATAWRERCEKAAAVGKQLLMNNAELQAENAELKRTMEALRMEQSANANAKHTEELAAVSAAFSFQSILSHVRLPPQRVRALQDQLRDAERLNMQLSQDIKAGGERLPRSSGALGAHAPGRLTEVLLRDSAGSSATEESEALRKRLETAEQRAARAEEREAAAQQLAASVDIMTEELNKAVAAQRSAEDRAALLEKVRARRAFLCIRADSQANRPWPRCAASCARTIARLCPRCGRPMLPLTWPGWPR